VYLVGFNRLFRGMWHNMVEKITVEYWDEEPTDTHLVIYDDGIVRHRLPVHEKTDKIRVIIVANTADAINDAQCQAASVSVAACMLKYQCNNVKGINLRWDDIRRRG